MVGLFFFFFFGSICAKTKTKGRIPVPSILSLFLSFFFCLKAIGVCVCALR